MSITEANKLIKIEFAYYFYDMNEDVFIYHQD